MHDAKYFIDAVPVIAVGIAALGLQPPAVQYFASFHRCTFPASVQLPVVRHFASFLKILLMVLST